MGERAGYEFIQWPKIELSQHTQLKQAWFTSAISVRVLFFLRAGCVFDSSSHSRVLSRQMYIKQTFGEGSQASRGGNG